MRVFRHTGLVRSGERGFSLVEMMVTMAVTLLILGGSFRAFDDARKATDAATLIADGNQNLRATVIQMTRDLIQTGRELPNGGIPIPSGAGSVDVRRPSPPGMNLIFPAAWEVLPSICPGPGQGPVVNGIASDIVTVLYSDPTLDLSEWPLASVRADGSQMTVDARTNIGAANNGIRAGDLIWFTNGLGNAIQTVTSVAGQDVLFAEGDPADQFLLNQRGAAQGTIMQIRSGAAFPPTSATRVIMVSYYLDTTTAPGQFRAVRRVGFGPARLIGVGIDNLQVSYDIVDGTTNPTNQADAVLPNTPSQIRKVNLFLAERSDFEFTVTRRFIRSSVATQVSLRSMSFVDRYQ
jgi:prepilin-type N-terminal cleavage/methylation domain-containing protein